jgi:tight adherence protein C
MAAALFGSKLPDIYLKNVQQKRLESIRKALPDSLDMLVICAEAGLSSDASLKRVVAETSRKSSVLGEELNQTALELSFMPERRQALENLAERAPLPSITAFTNTMIQAEKYGTPLARAFKVLSQEQRTERMLKAEEKAGRLPATMTVPMMLFILPALFIVLIGPAVLDILDNFINMKQ